MLKVEKWLDHEIRFVEINNEWWAVAKDVADALDYDRTRNMLRMIDNENQGAHKVSGLEGERTVEREQSIINELGIYEAIFGSHKQEAKEFKKWVFGIIKQLRQQSGLEGFQVFRMMDKEHQKEMMDFFEVKDKKDYAIINRMANYAVSKKFGLPKGIKKEEMTSDMLQERQDVLRSLVSLANMTGSKGQANKIIKQLLEIK